MARLCILDMANHKEEHGLPIHITKEEFVSVYYKEFLKQYETFYNDTLRQEQIMLLKKKKLELWDYRDIELLVKTFFPKARVWRIVKRWETRILIDNPEEISVWKEIKLFLKMRWYFTKFELKNMFRVKFKIEFGEYDPASDWALS